MATPDSPPVHTLTLSVPEAISTAHSLWQKGHPEKAMAICHDVLRVKPEYFDALHLLGMLYHLRGENAEALDCFSQARPLQPTNGELLFNTGKVLMELRRAAEAETCFGQAAALLPMHVETLFQQGRALCQLGRYKDAIDSYDRALALRPNFPVALFNRGNALREFRRLQDAIDSYDRALALQPDYAEALNNRGAVLRELKHFKEAALNYTQLLAVAPDHPYAMGNHLFCLMHGANWTDMAAYVQRLESAVLAGQRADLPFSFLAISPSAGAQLQCARTFTTDQHPPTPTPLWTGERYAHDKIRIAYLSADFHDHPMAYLMVQLLETHDRARFEIFGISFGPDIKSAMRQRLEKAVDHFIDVRSKSERDIALLLRDLEIDIAIDRKGYTQNARPTIFAQRFAPIQVNYLAYPGTLGADYIDYIIADPVIIPPGHEGFYHEQVVRLPDCYQPNDAGRQIAAHTPPRREHGLPETGFVFCSFNNSYKITPELFDIWMRLLTRVPGSVLWLLEANAEVAANLRREAAARGIDPIRLVFAPRMALPEHLARHRHADLFLDTLPVNAHTTASDALWSGLPLITCPGEAFASRVAASLLHAVGLPELVTNDLAGYEALSLQLATQPDELAAIKARLAANRLTSPLFDTPRYRQNLEQAYITMWEKYQHGQPPLGFDVAGGGL